MTATTTRLGHFLGIAGIGVLAAAATLAVTSGTALAPEPVKLTASLGATSGATAAAIYQNSGTPTQVVYLNTVILKTAVNPAVGTPCSTVAMPAGSTTSMVVTLYGSNYKKCM